MGARIKFRWVRWCASFSICTRCLARMTLLTPPLWLSAISIQFHSCGNAPPIPGRGAKQVLYESRGPSHRQKRYFGEEKHKNGCIIFVLFLAKISLQGLSIAKMMRWLLPYTNRRSSIEGIRLKDDC